jgi:hypothetical protein
MVNDRPKVAVAGGMLIVAATLSVFAAGFYLLTNR